MCILWICHSYDLFLTELFPFEAFHYRLEMQLVWSFFSVIVFDFKECINRGYHRHVGLGCGKRGRAWWNEDLWN